MKKEILYEIIRLREMFNHALLGKTAAEAYKLVGDSANNGYSPRTIANMINLRAGYEGYADEVKQIEQRKRQSAA